MDDLRDEELTCPRCARRMTRGFVDAGKGPLRWAATPKAYKSLFGGDHLAEQHWIWGRHVVPAARCPTCKLALLSYE